MRRIDCLYFTSKVTRLSQYGVLTHFAKKFHEALLALGIESRLWEVNKDYPGSFIKELLEDPPFCTVSFNFIIANDQGMAFCEDINIPHINILVDSPFYFFNQIPAKNVVWTCVDRTEKEICQLMGFKNLLFLPHGAEKVERSDEEKIFDVVMLSSFIDYGQKHEQWQDKFGVELSEIMDESVNLLLKLPQITTYQAFIEILDRHQAALEDFSLSEVLHEIEMQVRGRDRVELIKSIKSSRIDLFGLGGDGKGWKDQINQPNVFFHDAVPFSEAIKIIQKSKVVLNSCPTIKNGAHERVLTGLMNGTLPVSSESKYLREQFPDDAIIYYDTNNFSHVDSMVDEYLKNPEKRSEVLRLSRQIVLNHHTWEERAKQLIIEIVPILEKMKGINNAAKN